VKFAAAFDYNTTGDGVRSGLLTDKCVRAMFSPLAKMTPAAGSTVTGDRYYGLGWAIEPGESAAQFTARHGGALPCTASSLMHFPGGVNLAVVTNLGQSPDGKFLGRQLDPPLTELVKKHFP